MTLIEILKSLSGVLKDVTLLKDKFDRQEKDIEKQRDAMAALRDENARLTARVAVLEEGRKTTAAEVKSVLTEALATWQLQQRDQEIAALRKKSLNESRE